MTKLDEYISEFADLDPQEKLELLIEFGDSLPPLPEGAIERFHAGECRVQECQTPVFLQTEVEAGRLKLAAHVPEKSPTVRGFVAMLVLGLDREPLATVRQVPADLVAQLGLNEVLGMTRSRGFSGILARIRSVACQEGPQPG